LGEICQIFVKLPKKNKNKKRVVVITSGPHNAYVAEFDFIAEKITFFGCAPPVVVDEYLIVDTNGAGDAFAGGFLSKYMRKEKLDKCMHAGHWAASIIIQSRGCRLPEEMNYNEI
jgi:adenosine kinase